MKDRNVVLKTGRLALTLERPEEKWKAPWRIVRRDDGAEVGFIGFLGAPEGKTVELAFGIGEPYRGNGYAPEALKAIAQWAFSQPEVYFIRARAEEGCPAMARVLSKYGFLPLGEGEEGRLYELERPKSAYVSLFMSVGMSIGAGIGVSMGVVFHNLAMGISMGISIGLALGAAIGAAADAEDKKARIRKPYKEE